MNRREAGRAVTAPIIMVVARSLQRYEGAPPTMDVFLYAPELFENVCGIARTLSVLGLSRCYVFDPHRLIRPRYGKSRARQANGVSGGAFTQISFERVEEPSAFFAALPGRFIATSPEPAWQSLEMAQYAFRPSDCLVFGAESCGLPDDVLGNAAAVVRVPEYGATRSLNLGVSVAVLLYECLRQLGHPGLCSPLPGSLG